MQSLAQCGLCLRCSFSKQYMLFGVICRRGIMCCRAKVNCRRYSQSFCLLLARVRLRSVSGYFIQRVKVSLDFSSDISHYMLPCTLWALLPTAITGSTDLH